jgi:DNA-binding CsgD family transcriptional regulator
LAETINFDSDFCLGWVMNNSVMDLLQGLNGCSQARAWEIALEFFEQYGFHYVVYGMISKETNEIVGFHTNMPDAWIGHYMDNQYFMDDPFALHTNKSCQSIIYSRHGESDLILPPETVSEKILNEVSYLGFDNSICIPIHNSFGEYITGFNLISDMRNRDFRMMLEEDRSNLLMAAALVNNRMVDTSITNSKAVSWVPNPGYINLLSEREIEVIKWLSAGNRNDRIAEKMSIAPVTVNFHIREVKRKLGARTREQAVAIAFRKGLLR